MMEAPPPQFAPSPDGVSIERPKRRGLPSYEAGARVTES